MPFVRLSIAVPDVTPKVQAALAVDLTTLLETVLEKEYDHTVVHINLVPAESWFVAGVRPTDAIGAHLEVSITAGTNTPHDKAIFIDHAYDLLTRHLGLLADTVYVALYELDGRSYGFNGVTQEARRELDPSGRD